MSVWNKYGTISKDGKIDARFVTRNVHYPSAHELYTSDPVGPKYELPATVFVYDGHPCVYVDNVFIGRIENTWTQFVGQAAQRVLNANVHLDWIDDEQQFRLVVNIEET